MNPRILLRLARLARNPPGRQRQIMMAVVIGVIALIWGIEALFGWPEWATVNPRQRLP